MKKLILLLDEWDNDRNFVGEELELICDKYEVIIVCNSANTELNPRAIYCIYRRPSFAHAVKSFVRMLFDKDAHREFRRVMREPLNRLGRLSEAARFYINADLFAGFLKAGGLMQDGVIYYSYWYFWKCYAITHEIDKYPGSRVLTRTHQYDLYDHGLKSGYQPFKELMDDRLSSIVFIADYGRDYYLEKYHKQPSDKYKLYYLGTRQPDEPAEYIKGSCMTVVSCSSIIERKRVYRIAEALSLIDGIKIKWIHFGTGPKEEELKRLSAEILGPKENIEYDLKGYVKNEELHAFYRENLVDVFVTTSSSEGNPVSVMEAMSYGIPVIAPDVCDFARMIDGCGTLLSGECTGRELADAIIAMDDMPKDDYLRLRARARELWQERFNADINNKRFVEEVLDRM